jgi:hypothetical protein
MKNTSEASANSTIHASLFLSRYGSPLSMEKQMDEPYAPCPENERRWENISCSSFEPDLEDSTVTYEQVSKIKYVAATTEALSGKILNRTENCELMLKEAEDCELHAPLVAVDIEKPKKHK